MLNPDKGIYFYSHYYIYEMLDEYKKRYALEDMYIQKLKELKNPSEEHYDNLSLLRNYLLTERSISSTAHAQKQCDLPSGKDPGNTGI